MKARYAVPHHYTDSPDVDLLVPRGTEDDLGRTVLERLDELRIRRGPESRFAKVAEHRSAVVDGLRHDLAGEIDGAIFGCLPRQWAGAFCFVECLEGGKDVQVEEDVLLLNI